MDTITILGISLLFFYSLTTILQFYGIDTSVYSIYILFYIFIIVSRLILPMNYAKLFPDDTASGPITNTVSGPITDAVSGPITNTVSGPITNTVSGPITNTDDNVSKPTIDFPPPRPQGQVTNINRALIVPRPQGQVTNINRAPVVPPSPSPAPSTTSDATPPKKTKNQAPSGPTDLSGLAQGFGALFSAFS